MKWRTILIPEAFATSPEPPDAAKEADTDDLREIQCMIWGKGTAQSPLRLFVRVGRRHGVPPMADGPDAPVLPELPARQPTLEELEEVVHTFAPEGALIGLGVIVSAGPGAPLTTETDAPWVGVPLIQAGAAEGSPAARQSLILSPGALPHAH